MEKIYTIDSVVVAVVHVVAFMKPFPVVQNFLVDPSVQRMIFRHLRSWTSVTPLLLVWAHLAKCCGSAKISSTSS